MPPGLVALIFEPDTTPAGTVITTVVALKMLNEAFTVPIVIAVAEARLVPLKVIVEPTSWTTEAVIVIAGFEVADELAENKAEEVAVPRELVTRKVPFWVAEGDSTVILVSAAFTERTVTGVLIAAVFVVAGVYRITEEVRAVPRLVPAMSIASPLLPAVPESAVTVGAPAGMKQEEEAVEPAKAVV